MASTQQELKDFSKGLVTVLEKNNAAQNEAENAWIYSIQIENKSEELSLLENKAEHIRGKIATLIFDKHLVDAQIIEKKAEIEQSVADTLIAEIDCFG